MIPLQPINESKFKVELSTLIHLGESRTLKVVNFKGDAGKNLIVDFSKMLKILRLYFLLWHMRLLTGLKKVSYGSPSQMIYCSGSNSTVNPFDKGCFFFLNLCPIYERLKESLRLNNSFIHLAYESVSSKRSKASMK